MLTTRILALVLLQGCVWCDPGLTCDAIRNATTRSLRRCLFDAQRSDGVVCEIMAQYGGPETPDDELGFIHARFSFALLQEDDHDNASSLCVAARGMLMEKVYSKGNWSNATYARLNPVTELVLPFIGTLDAVATFDASKAMAWLDVDPECYQRDRRNSSCILALRVLTEYWDLKIKDHNPFHADFWSQLKRPYFELLGAQLLTFEVALKKQSAVPFVQTLLPMLVNGTGLRKFRANSFALEDPGRLLPPLPLLQVVDLNSDGIVFLHPDNFAATPNVTRLDLGSNFLSELPSTLWKLQFLTSLNLSCNPQLSWASLAANLGRLQDLRELFLSGIPLKTLAPAPLPHLHVLDVSRCGLNDTAGIDTQTSLRRLDLSGNPLRRLPPDLFLKMANLTSLFLSDVGLEDAPRLQLHADAELWVLDLSRNSLSSGDDVLLSGNVSLLNLSGNAIAGWTRPDAFAGMWELDVSRNALRAVTPEESAALDGLAYVDLGDNPLDCDDCSTPDLQRWLATPTSPVVLRVNATLCASPPPDAGRRVIDVVFRRATQCGFPLWAVLVAAGVALVLLLALGVALRLRYEIRYLRATNNGGGRDDGAFTYDASVIYCRSDRPWVAELERASRRRGLRLCLHESDFPLECLVRTRLESALQRSRTTVIVISQDFVRNEWCSWSLEMAILFSERLLLLELWPRLPRDSLSRRLHSLFDDPATPRLGWPCPDSGIGPGDAMRRLVSRLQGDEHILEQVHHEDDEQTPLLH